MVWSGVCTPNISSEPSVPDSNAALGLPVVPGKRVLNRSPEPPGTVIYHILFFRLVPTDRLPNRVPLTSLSLTIGANAAQLGRDWDDTFFEKWWEQYFYDAALAINVRQTL